MELHIKDEIELGTKPRKGVKMQLKERERCEEANEVGEYVRESTKDRNETKYYRKG